MKIPKLFRQPKNFQARPAASQRGMAVSAMRSMGTDKIVCATVTGGTPQRGMAVSAMRSGEEDSLSHTGGTPVPRCTNTDKIVCATVTGETPVPRCSTAFTSLLQNMKKTTQPVAVGVLAIGVLFAGVHNAAAADKTAPAAPEPPTAEPVTVPEAPAPAPSAPAPARAPAAPAPASAPAASETQPIHEAYALDAAGDAEKAIAAYAPLAQNGDRVAQYNLGVLYATAPALKIKVGTGEKVFRCGLGKPFATGFECECKGINDATYVNGAGLPLQRVRAVLWLAKAAEHYHNTAALKRDSDAEASEEAHGRADSALKLIKLLDQKNTVLKICEGTKCPAVPPPIETPIGGTSPVPAPRALEDLRKKYEIPPGTEGTRIPVSEEDRIKASDFLSHPYTGETSTFTVVANPMTVDGKKYHYLVKLFDVGTGKMISSVFVRHGTTKSIDVPLGTYEARYAFGTGWSESGKEWWRPIGYARHPKQLNLIEYNQKLTLYPRVVDGIIESEPITGANLGVVGK